MQNSEKYAKFIEMFKIMRNVQNSEKYANCKIQRNVQNLREMCKIQRNVQNSEKHAKFREMCKIQKILDKFTNFKEM